jgi:predicted  nucleic acid-binding Zn-ribbon protein
MAHEENGHVEHWTHRDLQCLRCGYIYDNVYRENPDCEVCGWPHFDILQEYYDLKGDDNGKENIT